MDKNHEKAKKLRWENLLKEKEAERDRLIEEAAKMAKKAH